MWERIKRFFRAMFGGVLDKVEDPEMILKQSIRDMRDKIPVMNNGLAKMRGAVNLLEQEVSRYKSDFTSSKARAQAALEAGDEELAASYALQMKQASEAMARSEEQLTAARGGYENALELKKDYMRQMDARTKEALQAIRDAQSAKWKAEVANVFETFEVADLSATHDEMVDKLRQKSAMQEARLQMATESVDMDKIKMEKRAEKIEAQAILDQLKVEMGLVKPSTIGTEVTKTLGTEQAEPLPGAVAQPESTS